MKYPAIELHLKSWAEAREVGIRLPNSVWRFRGQANASWTLETRFEREAKRSRSSLLRSHSFERRIIYDFQRRSHLHANSGQSDTVDCLALIQHHGGPTRLLDFSTSFYVAAFFAVETATNDAAIWCYNQTQLVLQLDKVRGSDYGDVNNMRQAFVDLAESIIANPRKSFNGVIEVEPYRLSERLSIQQGLFLFPCSIEIPFYMNLVATMGIEKDPKFLDLEFNQFMKINHGDIGLLKIIIPKESCEDALFDLADMNVTANSLFPGLDGFARSLLLNLRIRK